MTDLFALRNFDFWKKWGCEFSCEQTSQHSRMFTCTYVGLVPSDTQKGSEQNRTEGISWGDRSALTSAWSSCPSSTRHSSPASTGPPPFSAFARQKGILGDWLLSLLLFTYVKQIFKDFTSNSYVLLLFLTAFIYLKWILYPFFKSYVWFQQTIQLPSGSSK